MTLITTEAFASGGAGSPAQLLCADTYEMWGMDLNGNEIWRHVHDTSIGGAGYRYIKQTVIAPNGNILIVSGLNNGNLGIGRFTSDGTKLWEVDTGRAESGWTDICVNDADNIVHTMVGYLIVRDGSDGAFIGETYHGDIITTTQTRGLINHNGYLYTVQSNGWGENITRFNQDGTTRLAGLTETLPSGSPSSCYDVELLTNGNVIVSHSGYIREFNPDNFGTSWWRPLTGSHFSSSDGYAGSDIYVATYNSGNYISLVNSSGVVQWTISPADTAVNITHRVAVGSNGDVYTVSAPGGNTGISQWSQVDGANIDHYINGASFVKFLKTA